MTRTGEASGRRLKMHVANQKFGWLRLVRGGLARIFLGVLTVAVLAHGAANPSIEALIASVFGVLTCVALVVFGEPKATAPIFKVAALVGLGLAGWVFIQTLPSESLAHPVWGDVGAFAGNHVGTISIAPADSLAALVTLALPFAVFIGALVLFPSDDEARRMLSYIALLGGFFAVYGIFEFSFSPGTLLGGEKSFYLDSLTVPFVNRNTAGTFYGLISLLASTQVYLHTKQSDFLQLLAGAQSARGRRPLTWRFYFQISILAFCLVALFLTKSRGAVGSTIFAYLFFVVLVLSTQSIREKSPEFVGNGRPRLTRRLVRVIVGLTTVLLVGVVLADRALFRAEVQGLDDGRFCVIPAILQAVSGNELTGVGFGTFRLFFPAHRDPNCGVYGVWDRAHSVYLEGYLGLGLIFAMALAVGLVTLALTFVHGIRARRRLRIYPILGIAALLLVVAHSSVDFSLQIPGLSVVFAAMMAAVVTIARGRFLTSTVRDTETAANR